ncbi:MULTISPECIES: NAD(P)H-dependent flavin oxidoreductase [Paracoccus]|uniref:NAD(P)H-dependent flavin oxidoreductase n=1 Tax=Paracoccus TaxID=265 RepID=UPI002EDB6F08
MPTILQGRLRLPVIASPMFIVSNPTLVVAQCKAGVVGTIPSLNGRTVEEFEAIVTEIQQRLAEAEAAAPGSTAPFGVNLIAHRTNVRLEPDLEICIKHKVPIIITSLGVSESLIERVHAYGGIVLHDITNMKHARKAIGAGMDGIIAVCNGAGGHAGTLNPIALVRELRQEYDGLIALSGAISDGAGILGALALGADIAYIGTRFIATAEANARDEYKGFIIEGNAEDVVYTPLFSGVPANYLKASISRVGLDPENLAHRTADTMDWQDGSPRPKAWKEVWGSGQGIGTIEDAPTTAELVQRLKEQFDEAVVSLRAKVRVFEAGSAAVGQPARVGAHV